MPSWGTTFIYFEKRKKMIKRIDTPERQAVQFSETCFFFRT